jgi:hypothetical protein
VDKAYQLEVVLCDSDPPIWRRLRVLGTTTLHALHGVLQVAFGWKSAHLYQFEFEGRRFAEPDPDDDIRSVRTESPRRTRINDLALGQGSKLEYVYDFGDWWAVTILVEAVFERNPSEVYPLCVDGARRGPPEDSGGIPGYADLLDALANPRHPEHARYARWVPHGFDPNAFDAIDVTRLLQQRRRRP